jgi:hypothetical protein
VHDVVPYDVDDGHQLHDDDPATEYVPTGHMYTLSVNDNFGLK